MPEIKTRADSLRKFLSGAASDGGAQTDPNAALGNFRSSTQADAMGITVTSPIANLTVDFAAGFNGEGAGTLTAVGADDVTWTAPGGSAGAAVTILDTETKLIESNDASKFIIISRTTAAALTGAATVTLADVVNNVFGFDNVSSAEASAGDDEYRAFFIKNDNVIDVETLKLFLGTLGTQITTDTTQLPGSGAGTIETTSNFNDWPATGYAHIKTSGGATKEIIYYESRTATVLTVAASGRGLLSTSATAGAGTDTADAVPGIEIATEDPSSQPSGSIQTIANEDTAPTALTFNTGLSAADGIDHGTIAAGNILGVWIHRETPAGAKAEPLALHLIKQTFDAA